MTPGIVDTHVHVASADRVRYPLDPSIVEDERLRKAMVSAEALGALMDEAGVARAVLVQSTHMYRTDNRYAADVARGQPERFACVACVDFAEPRPEERLRYWAVERGVRCLRLFNGIGPDDPPLDDPRCAGVLGTARECGMSLTVVTRYAELARVARVAALHPDLSIAIDHLGRYPIDEPPPFPIDSSLLELASLANVSLKFSTVNQWANTKGTTPDREYFGTLVERFGAERLMWGSNYPTTRYKPYAETPHMAAAALSFLTPGELAAVLGGNAVRMFWNRA